jgi:hypothetical protein
VSGQAGRYQRSGVGMIGALVVLLVLIGGYVALRSLTSNDPVRVVKAVDYRQTAAFARRSADFHVLVPGRLPAGWRVTTVSYRPAPAQHWHLGALTDKGRYVGLEQGAEPVRSMVGTYVDQDAVAGRGADVAGSTWRSWTDSGGDLAFTRRNRRTTTLVVGHDVPRQELVGYITSLR